MTSETNTATVTRLSPGHIYGFQVRARTAAGHGPYGGKVYFQTLPQGERKFRWAFGFQDCLSHISWLISSDRSLQERRILWVTPDFRGCTGTVGDSESIQVCLQEWMCVMRACVDSS